MIGLEYVLKIFEMTQQELASKLEIKQQNIDSWIKGKRNIPKKWLPELANIFNIPEKYFQREVNFYDEERIQLMKLHGINNEKDLGYGVIDYNNPPDEDFIKWMEERKKEDLVRFNDKREKFMNKIQKILDLGLGSTNYRSSVISTQISSREYTIDFIESLMELYKGCKNYQSSVLSEIITSFELLQGKDLPYHYTKQSNIDFYNKMKKHGIEFDGEIKDNVDREALEFIYKIRDLIKEEEERIRTKEEKIKEEIRAMGFEESGD